MATSNEAQIVEQFKTARQAFDKARWSMEEHFNLQVRLAIARDDKDAALEIIARCPDCQHGVNLINEVFYSMPKVKG